MAAKNNCKKARREKQRQNMSDSEEICEDCNKEVSPDDKALVCSLRDNWFHIKCQRVSVADYDFLIKSDDSIQWFCKSCKGASQKVYKMLTLVHKRQDQLKSEIKNLSKNVQDCNGNITDLKANLHSVVSGTVKNILDERHEESVREQFDLL
ncbi:hypothetical protein DPMN_159375 [Dreissena polymorpha]|uniref:PHD-type domain-containing protein n=1 Tax=Dreissena polymorpha TaxID=45954 RepID=A0A9D4ELF5_DREPO|nr:hypothetical protein DPMN_159375 [Dreissena polymorpha]